MVSSSELIMPCQISKEGDACSVCLIVISIAIGDVDPN